MRETHTVNEVVCDHCGKVCQNKKRLSDHIRRNCPALNRDEGIVHELPCDVEGCDFIARRKWKNDLPIAMRKHKEQRFFQSDLYSDVRLIFTMLDDVLKV